MVLLKTPKRFVTFDLNVNVVDSGHDLLIESDYNNDILEADTIRRWLGHMSTLLGAIVRDAEQTIGRIDILGAEERHHLVSAPAVSGEPPVTRLASCAFLLTVLLFAGLGAALGATKLGDAEKAKIVDLQNKGIERCKADDDAHADEFFAAALKALSK